MPGRILRWTRQLHRLTACTGRCSLTDAADRCSLTAGLYRQTSAGVIRHQQASAGAIRQARPSGACPGLKGFVFPAMRPVVLRQQRGLSAQFRPGGVVLLLSRPVFLSGSTFQPLTGTGHTAGTEPAAGHGTLTGYRTCLCRSGQRTAVLAAPVPRAGGIAGRTCRGIRRLCTHERTGASKVWRPLSETLLLQALPCRNPAGRQGHRD